MKQSDSEVNEPIPYKYIDADNKVYKEPILKNDKGEISEDVSRDQSTISKKNQKKKIDIENLSEKEIKKLIDETTESIRQLGNKTNNLQKKLKTSLKQLNDKIQEGADILYKKEINSNELQWLQEKYDTKQNLLNTEKKINHSYKVQFKLLENKLNNRKIIKDSKKSLENDSNTNVSQTINKTLSTKSFNVNKSISVSNNLYMNIEDEIHMIKNKNKELITEITKIKDNKVSQKKEVDNIINGELDTKLKLRVEEFQQLNMMKMDCQDKYDTLNKSMDMAKEKIKHFEEKAKNLEGKNELIKTDKLENYKFWIDLIKKEIMNNSREDLINLIKNGQSEFLKQIDKSRNIKKKKKLLKDVSTEMIKENNIIEDKIVNPNKNIYAIFSLLNMGNNKNNNENINNDNLQLEKLLQDESIYNLISENDYRELINKKQEYIETSMRLEKTIESFIKTENSKYSRVSKAIKEKLVQLKLVKEKNKLIQEEVNNLENIYQLSLEKESIKKEIKQKMTIKKNKNILEKTEENNIKVKNTINIKDDKVNKKGKKIEKNLKENNSEEINNKEDEFPDTRDEQLKMIRKKYMEEENNNNNNENNDLENMENTDDNGKELNDEYLNEENIFDSKKEIKPEVQAPFKV